jgi:hypothetical protein
MTSFCGGRNDGGCERELGGLQRVRESVVYTEGEYLIAQFTGESC